MINATNTIEIIKAYLKGGNAKGITSAQILKRLLLAIIEVMEEKGEEN